MKKKPAKQMNLKVAQKILAEQPQVNEQPLPAPFVPASEGFDHVANVAQVVEQVFALPLDILPEEPFHPTPREEFERHQVVNWLNVLTGMGYKVTLSPLTEDTQPPVFHAQENSPAQENGFVKNDAGKTRFSLVPAEARLEVAKVFTHGAKKYPPHNYRKGTDWSRYMDALHRHMNDFELGQNVDEESGLLTLAHVAACAMILLTLQKTGKGTDDRAQ